jgi:oligoendopeptidase F
MASTTATSPPPDPDLARTEWDLGPLVDGEGDAGVESRMEQAVAKAKAFAERYRGRLQELDAAGLAGAMHELAEVLELAGRAGAYAALRFSTDTADPARGALLARAQERETELQTLLLFFELEWAALPEERAEELLASPELDFCGHHLSNVRRYREHMLSEPEERVLAEKALTGSSAWSRLFEEQTSALQAELAEGSVPLDIALARLTSPDGEVRRGAAEAVTQALAPGLRTRAFIMNTLLLDKSVDDRLRRYPHWLAARNLANEVSDESVEALLEAVRGRYEIARRWYRLKARVLGVERLRDYDRMAAIGDDETDFPFGEARELVLDCYQSFAGELGEITRRLFAERNVDAPARPGKRGGAFCAAVVPDVDPYVLLNYASRRRDVLTVAHELGHAVHFALSARQGVFHQHTPLTLSETASVFGETIVFARLLERDTAPDSRFALLAENLEDRIATVFRQIAMNRFEDLAHNARRHEGELAAERLGELWVESQQELLGDSVEITDGYRTWWSYIPHFIDTPGYVYAYAYGQLLALSVYERYEQRGAEFVPQYLELLAAGGSRTPEELGGIVDVDITDPGFWEQGLDLIERQLGEAEAAAEASGRV